MSTGFSPSSPYYSPYRASSAPVVYPGYRRYPPMGYSGFGYQAHRLSLLKQQMAGTVINTSREPVTLAQLTGKHDGDPVTAHPFSNPHYTGVAGVDDAVQRAGGVMGYIPHALGNVASTSIKGAVIGGGGGVGLAGLTILGGKLLGRLKSKGWISLTFMTLGCGFGGSVLGGLIGAAKAGFDTLRDLKDIIQGKR